MIAPGAPRTEPATPSRPWVTWAVLAGGCAVMAAYGYWFSTLDALDQFSAGWVIVVGAVVNVACAILGCYLVLRRMSLLGDAISHAVLPGLIIAFILSGRVSLGAMFLGAIAAGLLTTFLTETVHRRGGVPADASMGVVFSALFALGVVLIKRYTGGAVDLDADCVFNGMLVLVGTQGGSVVDIAGFELPRPFVSIAPVLLLNILFVVVLWKELKVTSFDPPLATSMGIRAGVMHYALMAMVALTTTASFEAVGSILVIAMLIVPAATAHLLTDRFGLMIGIAAALGAAASVIGYHAAYIWDVNPAGTMAVASGILYLLAVFLSPRYGVFGTLLRNLQVSLQILREDFLAMLYRLEEASIPRLLGPREAVAALGGGWVVRVGLRQLLRSRRIAHTAEGLQLTEKGRSQARQMVRSHRLWEAYLVERLGLPIDHVHEPAERMEHFIGQELRERIAADLGESKQDPHGRSIPHDPPDDESDQAEGA